MLYYQRREIFTAKSRIGLTGWGKFEKDEKLLIKNLGLNLFLFCFSVALFPMFANFPESCVSTRQWVLFARILVLFQLRFFFRNFIFMHFFSFLIRVVQVIDKTFFEFSQKDSVQKHIILSNIAVAKENGSPLLWNS